ncbi:hypothetical protein HRI_003828200 [Hibiscus trionum]|uniref:Uncharacterized protein n=1 Tax=Hibiscus trionum TaxID=183268 RepID=A0A9W7IT48_HIBTR|nr:hypothetical protein HRI_003828200 [Hibiscus trionum]
MATVSESPEDRPNPSPPASPPTPLPSDAPFNTEWNFTQVTPWIDYAVEQAVLYQKIIDGLEASRSRLTEIRSTSSAQTIDSLKDVKLQLGVCEDIAFDKVKEWITIAASNPLITGGTAFGLGFLLLKSMVL